jgi:hypothetical protein
MGSHVHACRLDALAGPGARSTDRPRTGSDHDLGCVGVTARAAASLAKVTT